MLFKDLLKVLVTVNCYTIRIDTYDWDSEKTIETNIYGMKEIPTKYDNLKVLTIHTNELYHKNRYEYFVTVYK